MSRAPWCRIATTVDHRKARRYGCAPYSGRSDGALASARERPPTVSWVGLLVFTLVGGNFA
jgi:hypothetical protein